MICPKCSSKIEDDSLFCSECGSNLRESVNEKSLAYNNSKTSKYDKVGKGGVVAIIIAIIGFIAASNAASEISTVAKDMMDLRSQSGTSLAEVYYQDVGKALKGFAIFCRAFGASSLAITIAVVFRRS